MSNAVVLCETDRRGVATVTLNRPEVNNAYNTDVVQALLDFVTNLAADNTVRMVVIRGNGRHFQAGADLKLLQEIGRMDAEANRTTSLKTAGAMRGLNEMSKPTVALVQGACVGGGTGIVASCDIVIAEHTATFAVSEARWGMAATIIFPQLNSAIGIRQVRRAFAAQRLQDLVGGRQRHTMCGSCSRCPPKLLKATTPTMPLRSTARHFLARGPRVAHRAGRHAHFPGLNVGAEGVRPASARISWSSASGTASGLNARTLRLHSSASSGVAAGTSGANGSAPVAGSIEVLLRVFDPALT